MSAEQKNQIEKLIDDKLESLKKQIHQLNESVNKNKDKFEKFEKDNDKLELDNAKNLENQEKENKAVEADLAFMRGNWVKHLLNR